jgi:segregation and condensation protein A
VSWASTTAESPPAQATAVLAVVHGQRLEALPEDLYIPPDALEVLLETFQGPLDLLLYLIRRQNLDILDIPIATITEQYMRYVELMAGLRLELAAEYLLMAALLAEIKSRMLLPRPVLAEDEEDDPRAELVRRLQEYERYRSAADALDALPRMDRDTFAAHAPLPPQAQPERPQPQVALAELLAAFADALHRSRLYAQHRIGREALSVRERMSLMLEQLENGGFLEFRTVLRIEEGPAGVVVCFLATLELLKAGLIELLQVEAYGVIRLRLAAAGDGEGLRTEAQP